VGTADPADCARAPRAQLQHARTWVELGVGRALQPRGAPFREGWDARIVAIEEGGLERIVAGTIERWFAAATRAGRPDVVRQASEMLLSTSPAGYIGCAHALKGLDYLRRLGEMNPPVLYAVGLNHMLFFSFMPGPSMLAQARGPSAESALALAAALRGYFFETDRC
jgi:hypothetical protein